MTLTPNDISIILAALQESDWDEAVVVVDDVTISVARNGARLAASAPAVTAPPAVSVQAAVATPAPATTAAAADPVAASTQAAPVADPGDHVVTAPSVGVFWRSPEPGAAPFVEVGAEVGSESTIGIVEIMKLMNNIVAGTTGVVSAIHVENGQSVEFGTALVSIRTSTD